MTEPHLMIFEKQFQTSHCITIRSVLSYTRRRNPTFVEEYLKIAMSNATAVTAGVLLAGTIALASTVLLAADKPAYTALTNAQALTILDQVEKDIKENYYDPSMHGFDLDKRFDEARAKIKNAQSQDDALLAIAAAVAALHDSHTGFIPPRRPYNVDYGFAMQAVGDSACYVTAVKPGSDAEAKGLKRGDQIVSINGVKLARQDLRVVQTGYAVFPQAGFHLDVKPPEGDRKSLLVMAKVTPGQREISTADFDEWIKARPTLGQENKSRFFEVEKKVLFWKLPNFMIDPHDVGDLAKKARPFDTVVLDLRGNPGGRQDVLQALLGEFLDHDVTIGELKGRNGTKPLIAKGRGKSAIGGKLIVLIDSDSASASEIFSRTVQLEKRGTVIGDHSSGAVMTSQSFVHAAQIDAINVTQYWSSITIEDVVLSNGERLEGLGVTPDEEIVPTPADVAAGRDPILARAAALAGVEMTPEKAGGMFPFKWPEAPIKIQ